jgi:hypothetical protein
MDFLSPSAAAVSNAFFDVTHVVPPRECSIGTIRGTIGIDGIDLLLDVA